MTAGGRAEFAVCSLQTLLPCLHGQLIDLAVYKYSNASITMEKGRVWL